MLSQPHVITKTACLSKVLYQDLVQIRNPKMSLLVLLDNVQQGSNVINEQKPCLKCVPKTDFISPYTASLLSRKFTSQFHTAHGLKPYDQWGYPVRTGVPACSEAACSFGKSETLSKFSMFTWLKYMYYGGTGYFVFALN